MIFTVCVSFSVILTSIRLALTSVLPANTGTSQNALALVLWYSGFGVVGEYHGETLSISSRSSRSSKNRILRAPLCLATYLVCASAPHPAITCAILSGHSWHIRHIASLVVSVRVLFWLYNFVGTSCWYSSNSPAMVFVGASCHLHKQLKQSTRSVSIHRVCINFPCYFWSLIVSIRLAFILYCITFPTFSLEMSSLDPVLVTTAPGERLSSRPISSFLCIFYNTTSVISFALLIKLSYKFHCAVSVCIQLNGSFHFSHLVLGLYRLESSSAHLPR